MFQWIKTASLKEKNSVFFRKTETFFKNETLEKYVNN